MLDQLRSQTAGLWSDLAPSQRLTLVAVTVALVVGFSMIALPRDTSGYVPLSVGKAFTVEEAIHAESVLMAAGLTDFEQRGGQIRVPTGEVEKYNAALIAGGGMPTNWAEEWESQTNKLGQFAGSRQRQDGMEIARAKMVSEYLRQLPDVAQANVIWDVDERPGWQSVPVTKATVYLRPQPGREITPQLAAAVRMAVAGSKRHLDSEDVVVMDMVRGRTLEASGGGPFGDETLSRVHALTDMYRSRVRQSLDYIPGVRVAVNVDIEKLKDSVVRSQKVNPKESVTVNGDTRRTTETVQRTAAIAEPGAQANVGLKLQTGSGPGESRELTDSREESVQTASFEITESTMRGGLAESVSVSVSIPKEYYRTVAMTRSPLRTKDDPSEDEIDAVAQQVETDVIAAVEAKVKQLVPTPTVEDPNRRSVVVDSIVVPENVEADAGVPLSLTITDLVSRYARPLALLALAIVALWLVNRSMNRPMPELPAPPPPRPNAQTSQGSERSNANKADGDSEEDAFTQEDDFSSLLAPPQNRRREHLQTVVKDNPELAANVLKSWMAEA